MMSVTLEESATWKVFTNGLSNSRGTRTNLLFESKIGLIVEVSLHFEFTTNNLEKYEAFIVGLTLVSKIGVEEVML